MIIFTQQQRLMQRNAQQWLTRHLSHQRKTIVPSVPHNMRFFSQQQQPSFEQQQQVGRTYVPSTSDSSETSSTQQSSFTSDLEKERIMAQRIRSTSHGGKSGEIPKFRQQGGRSKLSTILMRLVISGGLGVACMVVAYGYYVTNKDKLSFTKNLEEEKKKKTGLDGGDGDGGVISANTVQKGFFSVGRTKTLRYQYIVTRSRIYELEVCRGELFNEKTDAIIVATTENLQPHDSALTDKSGREQTMKQLQEALVKNGGPFKPGQVVVTEVKSDDHLNCKYLIHAVTPMYEGGQKLEVFQLSQAIYNALLEADKLSLESVSIPAIGTGNARFPREKCANVLFDSVFTYFNDRDSTVAAARQNKMSLHNVRFTNSEEQSIEAFVKEYDHKKRMGKILV